MAKWLSLLTAKDSGFESRRGFYFLHTTQTYFFFKTPFETMVPFNCRVTTKIITGSHPSKRFHGYLLFGFSIKADPKFLGTFFWRGFYFCIQHKHIFFFKTPFETMVPFNCRVTTKIITGSHPSKRFHGYLLFGFFN